MEPIKKGHQIGNTKHGTTEKKKKKKLFMVPKCLSWYMEQFQSFDLLDKFTTDLFFCTSKWLRGFCCWIVMSQPYKYF